MAILETQRKIMGNTDYQGHSILLPVGGVWMFMRLNAGQDGESMSA